jgi:hypothetical protein
MARVHPDCCDRGERHDRTVPPRWSRQVDPAVEDGCVAHETVSVDDRPGALEGGLLPVLLVVGRVLGDRVEERHSHRANPSLSLVGLDESYFWSHGRSV